MKTVRDCLKDGNYYASAFFSQQAAEKALKGFLYAQGYRAIVTHSVMELLGECSKFVIGWREFLDYGKELDRHYIGSRYPNFYPSGVPYMFYTGEMAERCANYAELILEEVRKYLKK